MTQASVTTPEHNRALDTPVNKKLAALFIGLCMAELATKLWMIGQIGLFGDGAFYWLESRDLAPAYSDIPFMTALLVKVGTVFFGDTLYGVRIPFVLMGSSIPLLVYWLALPLAGRKKALISGILCCCTPMIAAMGVVAVPDVPLLFFSILALGFFERAVRTSQARFWFALSICGALGFSTHYRFIVLPFSLFIFALITPSARGLFKNKLAVLAGLLTLIGFLPALWFNLNFDWQAIGFHFHTRHPGIFNARGLLQPIIQMAIITPFMYIGLIVSGIWGVKQHNQSVRMLAICGLVYIIVYSLAAPWADQRSSSGHWPLTGYLPLLALLPMVLNGKRIATGLIAVSAFICLLGLLVYGYYSGNYQKIPIKYQPYVSSKFDGFEQLAKQVSQLPKFKKSLLVTDNYYLGAQLAFHLNQSEKVFFIEHDKAFRDGRHAQIYLWDKYVQHIPQQENVIIVIEKQKLHDDEMAQTRSQICKHFRRIKPIGETSQFFGEKRYQFLSAQRYDTRKQRHSGFCHQPIVYDIHPYLQDMQVFTRSDTIEIGGWLYQSHEGIETLQLIVDGKPEKTIHYGIPRHDVGRVHPDAQQDPNYPRVGLKTLFKLEHLNLGWHEIEIRTTSLSGHQEKLAYQRFFIKDG